MNFEPDSKYDPTSLDQGKEVTGFWENVTYGKHSYRVFTRYPVTWLRTCDACGLLGGPRKVAYRSECHVYKWDFMDIWFCIPCWNRAKALVKTFWTLRECQSMINKIKRLTARKCAP